MTTTAPDTEHRPQLVPIITGMAGVFVCCVLAAQNGPLRNAGAVLTGALAGLVLYHASFGFTSAWRQFSDESRGAGLRAQMLLIALVIVISHPLIAYGDRIGLKTYGFVVPFGTGSAFGAFLFGVGMQFGSGCASGTLFTSGGGSVRMMIVLLFFVLGSVIGTAHVEFWGGLPRFGGISLVQELGMFNALALTLVALGAIALISIWRERQRWGELEVSTSTKNLINGPWPKVWGATGLAVVSILTLLLLHRPWGITSGFALWGAKGLMAIGVDVDMWAYWSGGRRASLVERSVFADSTSVMNFGIIGGALVAAGLAAKYRPTLSISPYQLVTAILGGLAMGYGARQAYGCNIGAYLGGLVSGSIHGWWWLIFGFAGSIVGSRSALWLKQRFDR